MALSNLLKLQLKGNLYLRRMAARAATGDWEAVTDDAEWLREKRILSVLPFELEALALSKLGNPQAIESYEQAATWLKDANSYGFEEFDSNWKEVAWRTFKLAFYKERVADVYQSIGRSEEATAAYVAAQHLLNDAYAASDLTPQTRTQLDQLSSQLSRRH